MKNLQRNTFFRKCSGIIIAVAGIAFVVNVLSLYLWPLFLGFLLIWMGWRLYILRNF